MRVVDLGESLSQSEYMIANLGESLDESQI